MNTSNFFYFCDVNNKNRHISMPTVANRFLKLMTYFKACMDHYSSRLFFFYKEQTINKSIIIVPLFFTAQ